MRAMLRSLAPLSLLVLSTSCAPQAGLTVPVYEPLPGARVAATVATARATAKAAPGEPSSFAAAAQRITAEALQSRHAYELLRELCDDIGARLSGSPELTRALAWAKQRLGEAGHENVRIEPVMVPTWVRGRESLAMVVPLSRAIPVLGIGGSVSTPKGGLTGELVVVHSETELATRAADIRGKIVLIDKAMPAFDPATHDTHYGETVRGRVYGASLAAKHGASALLVRSVTARSLGTLHTGSLVYDPAAPKIPAGSVTVESATWLSRLVAQGKKVTLRLQLESRDLGLTESGNVLAELRGREKPEEIVVISGHIDSWDVGQGAADDGAGVVIAMEALSVLR
jgi:carboxypeptidase Q